MNVTDLHFDEDPHDSNEFAGHGFPHLRLLDDSEVPASGDLLAPPPCAGCFEAMAPIGASGWWCDPCQEYQ